MTGVVDLPSNRVERNIFRSRTSVRALLVAPSEHYDLSVPRTERGDCFAGRGCDFFAGSKKNRTNATWHAKRTKTHKVEG